MMEAPQIARKAGRTRVTTVVKTRGRTGASRVARGDAPRDAGSTWVKEARRSVHTNVPPNSGRAR